MAELVQEISRGPCREKYWEECTTEEQIARLREELVAIADAQMGMVHCLADLTRHSHAVNGMPAIALAAESTERAYLGRAFPRVPYRIRTSAERK